MLHKYVLMSLFVALLLRLPTVLSAASPLSPKPCIFPSHCACFLTDSGRQLKCYGMQRCMNQVSMDAMASAMQPKSCPVETFFVSCSPSTARPTLDIVSSFFRRPQWRRLRSLQFGSKCNYAFRQPQVLSQLPHLTSLALMNTTLSTNLSRFSETFCCPKQLATILIIGVEAETGGTKFSRSSFQNFPVLNEIVINNSSGVMEKIDLVLNTHFPSFSFTYVGDLPIPNVNFSSFSFVNQAKGPELALKIVGSARAFNLDAPADIRGFEFTSLTVSRAAIDHIGDSPFQSFPLVDVTVVESGLDGNRLRQLLGALQRTSAPNKFNALAVQFTDKSRIFPFDDFNALCSAMPLLRQLEINHSPTTLAVPGRYLECPQLQEFSLTNCFLGDADLPSDAFSRLPNLGNIKLAGNKFTAFPTEAFRFTNKVSYLDVSGNNVMELRANFLQGVLPSLETLWLSHTAIAEPLTSAFVGQQNLTNLHINALQMLHRIDCPFTEGWFQNCTRLKTLSMARISNFVLTSCTVQGLFDPLQNLEELILTDSGFEAISTSDKSTLLANLKSLKTLRLNGNNVKKLELFLTAPMPSLTSLIVSRNSISGIPKHLLTTMTPKLRLLRLTANPIVYLNPETFSRLPNLMVQLGGNQFACTCALVPFADWMRQQMPNYMLKNKDVWLSDAFCYTMPNGSHALTKPLLLDFWISWWDCYNRRLIVLLASATALLALLLCLTSLLVRFRWKLHYSLLAFCIRHHLVRRRVPSEWSYDACFIYDETDSRVSQWVEDLIHKLETDLQLRLYEPERDAPAGANILDEAASAIDKSRHAVLVLTRGFLENRLNMYSAQWSNESLFMRRRSLAVMVMRERLSESELKVPGCKVLHRLYRMCKPDRIVDCSGCGVGSNSASRLGLMLYTGARISGERHPEPGTSESEPLLGDG